MPELAEVPRNGLPQQSDVKVASLCRLSLVLVQLRVDAARQLGPVGVQATLPAGGVAREEPVLVAMRAEAVTPLLLPLTRTGTLQGRTREGRRGHFNSAIHPSIDMWTNL